MGSKDDQLTTEEYERLYQQAKNAREKLIISLAGELGLRASEISNLRKNWINFQNKKIVIPSKDGNWTPKTKAGARAIPYRHSPRITTLIESYFALETKIGMSRQGIHKLIKVRAKDAGITHNIYPHALRSTAAQKWIAMGFKENPLRTVMGWERLSTAEAYIRHSGIEVDEALDEAQRRGRV